LIIFPYGPTLKLYLVMVDILEF